VVPSYGVRLVLLYRERSPTLRTLPSLLSSSWRTNDCTTSLEGIDRVVRLTSSKVFHPGPVEVARAGPLAVTVRGLVKSYSGTPAVRGIDLAIRQGEVFALLGPNGAGKTTTVEILEGYRTRDGGEVSVLGVDPGRERARLKSRVGIVLQSTGVDRYLTVRETIAMYASFYPRPRPVDEVIHLVGLEEKCAVRVLKLSGGQQRRLDVAIALVGNPELLFLDEPTTGFDPSARHEAWDVIKNLATLGMTVLLTTHYMDEAQFLADRVAVIVGGLIVAEGPPATLGDRNLATTRIRYRAPAGATPPEGLFASPGADGYTEITTDDVAQALLQLSGWAIEHRVSLDDLEVSKPSLEDIYLSLTGDAGGAKSDQSDRVKKKGNGHPV
jgi:ABC-2 type transport system ATP-binding protein